jgi:hypothetical protein
MGAPVKERLCFVQFLHPGGEHGWDEPGLKHWNRAAAHRRKFLKCPGRRVDASERLPEGEIEFWGEWEPSSTVTRVERRVADGPEFIHTPFLPSRPPDGWRQNTDPFVFGEPFHYYGCLQHTKYGPTQLRLLAYGSVILFGSCLGRSRFVLDTVLVVDGFRDDSMADHRRTRRTVSPTYAAATIDPWHSGGELETRSYRLYSGATFGRQVAGMYSFFPCEDACGSTSGFARPTITVPELITPTMAQGKRLNPQPDINRVAELWRAVVEQVRAQGLDLGVYAELPPTRRAERWVVTPRPREAC